MTEQPGAVLILLALLAACGGSSTGLEVTSVPTDPILAEPLEPGEIVGATDYLVTSPAPGPVSPQGDGLLAPSGLGVWRSGADRSAPPESLPTPGWARAVVPVPGALWVADGVAGITVLHEGDAAPVSWPRGTVEDLVSAGPWTLAAVGEGELLVLEPGPALEPQVVGRLVLDGRPLDLDAVERPDGWHFAVACQAAGLYTGRVDGAGRPRLTGRLRRYVRRVAIGPTRAWGASGAGLLVGGDAGPDGVQLPAPATGLVELADGTTLVAAGASGLLARPAGPGREPGLLRQRTAAAVALGADADRVRAWVTWSDGLVEQLDGSEVVASWTLPTPARVTRVGGGLVGRVEHDGAAALVHVRQGWRLPTSRRVRALAGAPGQSTVALGPGGGLRVWWQAGRPAREAAVWAGVSGALLDDGAGGLWVADEGVGLVHVNAEGQRQTWSFRSGFGAGSLVADHRWVAAGAVMGGEILALPADGGAPVRLLAGADPADLELIGDHLVAGLVGGGVEVFDLAAGSWSPSERLPLPWPVRLLDDAGRLCPAPGGVLQALGERGLAVLDLEPGAAPGFRHVLDTPGRALDCAPSDRPGRYLVADDAGLLEVEVDPGG